MLIDEILFAINKNKDAFNYLNNAILWNQEICSLLTHNDGAIFGFRMCVYCNKYTIHYLFTNLCYSNEHKKEIKYRFEYGGYSYTNEKQLQITGAPEPAFYWSIK